MPELFDAPLQPFGRRLVPVIPSLQVILKRLRALRLRPRRRRGDALPSKPERSFSANLLLHRLAGRPPWLGRHCLAGNRDWRQSHGLQPGARIAVRFLVGRALALAASTKVSDAHRASLSAAARPCPCDPPRARPRRRPSAARPHRVYPMPVCRNCHASQPGPRPSRSPYYGSQNPPTAPCSASTLEKPRATLAAWMPPKSWASPEIVCP
jgi:hypothetical protein